MRDDGGVDERDKSVIHKNLKFYIYYILALDLNILYIQKLHFSIIRILVYSKNFSFPFLRFKYLCQLETVSYTS